MLPGELGTKRDGERDGDADGPGDTAAPLRFFSWKRSKRFEAGDSGVLAPAVAFLGSGILLRMFNSKRLPNLGRALPLPISSLP